MEQKKKIAFVSNTLWSIFHFRFQLIRRLLQEGFEVLVLAPADDTSKHFEDIPNLRFIPLRYLDRGFVSPLQEWRLFRELRKYYLALKPDLVFHYTIKPNIIGSRAARAEGLKSIAVVTGLGYTLTNRTALRIMVTPLYRSAFKKIAQVWFLNEGDRLFFTKHALVKPDQAFLLPGEGVDISRFTPQSDEPNPGGSTHFLMIARLLKNKGVPEFIQAAEMITQRYPGTMFTLVGAYDPNAPDAITPNDYKDLLKQKKISYLNYQTDVRAEIAKADAFVLPSLAEGLSMSVMEAASMGKPVIVSDVPGCRELVIPDVSGFLCEPADATSLADKMEALIEKTPEQRKSMGSNGRKLMKEKYALEIVIDLYIQNIKNLLRETNDK